MKHRSVNPESVTQEGSSLSAGRALDPGTLARDDRPRASVVLCVYNRQRSVLGTLESLLHSDFAGFEIVAVDDASTDDTLAVLKDFRISHPSVRMTIVTNERNLGVSGARNSGVRAARGSVVLFTDSDCVVAPDWIRHHLVAYEDPGVAAACGPVEDAPPSTWAERAYSGTTRVGRGGLQRRPLVGGNMSLRRDVLLELEFDAALRYGCDEDDLAWRLEKTGHRIAFAPEAHVVHHHPLDLVSYLRMAYLQGQGSARYWYKRGVYLGRDLAALAAAAATLPVAAAVPALWPLPPTFLALQVLALLYSETAFKGKSLASAIGLLPMLMPYSVVKLAGVVTTYARLALGGESEVRRSKRAWRKSRSRDRASPA